MPKLIICPDSGDCRTCDACCCSTPHYEEDCPGAKCPGMDCVLIDEEQRLEAEEEYREVCEWWINPSMWAENFIEQFSADSLFQKFCEMKPINLPKEGTTIKFKRYNNDHLADALRYGIGVLKDGTTITKDFLQEEATGRKDSDGSSN